MAVKVQYDQDCRMTITGVECSCGCEHHAIDKDIYIGKGLLEKVPQYITRRGWARQCLLRRLNDRGWQPEGLTEGSAG